MSSPGPGWYDDPAGNGMRWWDGQAWAPTTRMVKGSPMKAGQSWLESIRDTGPGRIERGDSRWIAGWAIVATEAVLAVSSFLEWGSTKSHGYVISMNGYGHVAVTPPPGEALSGMIVASRLKSDFEAATTSPGAGALAVGLIAALAGAAYLWTARRSIAALVAAFAGGIFFLICVGNLLNVSVMLGEPSSGSYSIGFGLLLACATALTLVGIGITAFALERIAIGSRPPNTEAG